MRTDVGSSQPPKRGRAAAGPCPISWRRSAQLYEFSQMLQADAARAGGHLAFTVWGFGLFGGGSCGPGLRPPAGLRNIVRKSPSPEAGVSVAMQQDIAAGGVGETQRSAFAEI